MPATLPDSSFSSLRSVSSSQACSAWRSDSPGCARWAGAAGPSPRCRAPSQPCPNESLGALPARRRVASGPRTTREVRAVRVLSVNLRSQPNRLSLLFNIAAAPGGRGTVGGRAHRSSLREDTDPKQNVARIVSPNTGSAGGKGSLGREDTPSPSTSVWPVAPVGRGLCGPAVPVMEPADQGCLDDPALIEALHRSGLWGVLVQGEVCSGAVVVDEVVAQQATQVGRVEHDQMIKALAAQGADEAFNIGILPRRPRRRLDFEDPQGLDSAGEHDPVTASRSRRRYRGAVSQGNASTSCWAVHCAVGASVTLTWTTRRRSCARTTKTNRTLNITVGTVKKSTETRLPMWLARKVRQVCDGGVRRRTRYLETVAWEISRPTFWSSP